MHWSSLAVCCAMSLVARGLMAEEPWLVMDGYRGPGNGKHIVFVSGDDEYRSEEAMPMLAKILAVHHGFRCTVLFAIDPNDGTIKPDYQTNIPGLHHLETADMMVLFTRFRELPDEQMKYIIDFTNSGKPILGLRTATHPFNYTRNPQSPYAKYSFDSREPVGGYGRQVLGETWVSHHGQHGKQSTRGVINQAMKDHPILKGVDDIWGPTDVYGITRLSGDATILVWGQVLEGMKPTDKPVLGPPNDPMMPLVWIKHYTGETGNQSRVVSTTMGASVDLASEGLRRLLVNACYWGVGLEDQIPARSNVELIGTYELTFFGFGKYRKGRKPSDFAIR
jgi:hypothetical protein